MKKDAILNLIYCIILFILCVVVYNDKNIYHLIAFCTLFTTFANVMFFEMLFERIKIIEIILDNIERRLINRD